MASQMTVAAALFLPATSASQHTAGATMDTRSSVAHDAWNGSRRVTLMFIFDVQCLPSLSTMSKASPTINPKLAPTRRDSNPSPSSASPTSASSAATATGSSAKSITQGISQLSVNHSGQRRLSTSSSTAAANHAKVRNAAPRHDTYTASHHA